MLNLVGESTSNKVKSENIFSEGNNIHFRTVENINMCGSTIEFDAFWRGTRVETRQGASQYQVPIGTRGAHILILHEVSKVPEFTTTANICWWGFHNHLFNFICISAATFSFLIPTHDFLVLHLFSLKARRENHFLSLKKKKSFSFLFGPNQLTLFYIN